MGVRVIGVRFVGDYADLSRAYDNVDRKTRLFERRMQESGRTQTAAAQRVSTEATKAADVQIQAQQRSADATKRSTTELADQARVAETSAKESAQAAETVIREREAGARAAQAAARATAIEHAESVRAARASVAEAAEARSVVAKTGTDAERAAAAETERLARQRLATIQREGAARVAAAREAARVEIESSAQAMQAAREQAREQAATAAATARAARAAAAEELQAQRQVAREQRETARAAAREQLNAQRAAARVARDAQREETARTRQQSHRASAATEVGTGLIGAGVVTGLGIAVAVKQFADFDQAMSRARAGTQATAGQFDELRAAALKAGADTQFSATEAADGITALGKAGVGLKDILGGGLKGSLDLAAAGELDVKDAAEIAATAMTQFGLKGEQIPHVADLLAAGAGKAQGEVSDLAYALKYVGPVAAGMGISIEQTTGVLAEFASQGIVSEQAGTSFRGLLSSLSSPSKKASDAMRDLGIRLYDAKGNFIGMEGVAGQLQSAFHGMSKEMIDANLGIIFGNEQLTAARILYQGGSEAVKEWTKRVNDAGFASRQAHLLTDNLAGDFERLRGSLSTVFITNGSGANSGLRSITQGLENLVNAYGGLPEPAQKAVFYITAVGTASLLTTGLLLKLSSAALTAKRNLDALGVSSAALKSGLGGLGIIASGAAGIFAGLFVGDKLTEHLDASKVSVDSLSQSLARFSKTGNLSTPGLTVFTKGFGPLKDEAHTTSEALKRFGHDAENALDQGYAAKFQRAYSLGEAGQRFGKEVDQIDKSLANLVRSGHADEAADAFQKFVTSAVKAGVPNAVIQQQFTEYQKALNETLGSTDKVSAGTKALGDDFKDAGTEAQKAASQIQSAMEAAGKAADKAFDKDTSVLANFKPDDGKATERATERVQRAEERLTRARERASQRRTSDKQREDSADRGSKGRASSSGSGVQSAQDSVDEARKALAKAKSSAGDNTLKASYDKTIREARQFSLDIADAYQRGLNPRSLQDLIAQGPQQAGPILRQLVSDHSGQMIKMVNTSERTLRRINRVVVEEARLTAAAIQHPTDELSNHLDTAMRIAEAKAKAGGHATAEELAKALKLPPNTVETIANEFGIKLRHGVQAGVGKKPIVVHVTGAVRYYAQNDPTIDPFASSKRFRPALPLPKRADGGPLAGDSPNDRADDILFWGTSQEFVQPRRAVRHYGEAFMESVRTLQFPKYADGGQLGRPTVGSSTIATTPPGATTKVQVSAPNVVTVPVHETHTRAVHIENVNLPSPSPRETVAWAVEAAR